MHEAEPSLGRFAWSVNSKRVSFAARSVYRCSGEFRALLFVESDAKLFLGQPAISCLLAGRCIAHYFPIVYYGIQLLRTFARSHTLS
jgi:hypothetical protein